MPPAILKSVAAKLGSVAATSFHVPLLSVNTLALTGAVWVIVPVVVFLALFGGERRKGLAVTAFLVFAFAVSPWLLRNLAVGGTLFGTAGYAVVTVKYAQLISSYS